LTKVKIEIYGKELVNSVRDALLACGDSLEGMRRRVALNARLEEARTARAE